MRGRPAPAAAGARRRDLRPGGPAGDGGRIGGRRGAPAPARTRAAGPSGAVRRWLAGLLLGLPLLAPAPLAAQPREFGCVGAEALEDDVFAIPFAGGSAALREAATPGLDAAAALARAAPARNLCVLGHADRAQGAGTSTRLAAERARAVAAALSARGVERDRIRAEARVGAFSGRGAEPGARAVTIVVMPAGP